MLCVLCVCTCIVALPPRWMPRRRCRERRVGLTRPRRPPPPHPVEPLPRPTAHQGTITTGTHQRLVGALRGHMEGAPVATLPPPTAKYLRVVCTTAPARVRVACVLLVVYCVSGCFVSPRRPPPPQVSLLSILESRTDTAAVHAWLLRQVCDLLLTLLQPSCEGTSGPLARLPPHKSCTTVSGCACHQSTPRPSAWHS